MLTCRGIDRDDLRPDLGPGAVHDVLVRHLALPPVCVQDSGGACACEGSLGVRIGEAELLAAAIAIPRTSSGALGLVTDVHNNYVPELLQPRLEGDRLGGRAGVVVLGGFEDAHEVPVHPVDVITEDGKTPGTGQVLPDHLPVGPVEPDAVDAVLLGVHPVHVVCLHVHREPCRVADAVSDQGLSVAAVKVCPRYLGVLAVVEPVDELLHGVDGHLPGAVRGG